MHPGTPERPGLQFLQTPHPPARKFRGRTPCVHQGFLTTWRATGVHDQVLSLLRDLLAAAPNPDAVRVLCTGHSLGGAVAQLASFDIARELGVPPAMMSVYTFGCPRIGNRALAAESAEVVPDTWHVINDQDVVTRGMKVRPLRLAVCIARGLRLLREGVGCDGDGGRWPVGVAE